MLKPHNFHISKSALMSCLSAFISIALLLLCAAMGLVWAQGMAIQKNELIVVKDSGGMPTLAYYQAYGLARETQRTSDPKGAPVFAPQTEEVTDAVMLPVRSTRMSPGLVEPRSIHAPGLRAIFLIGDDEISKAWLIQRRVELQELHAVGLVVNVETKQALEALRKLAPGILLSPVSGDDLSIRLDLLYYPALITFDSVSQ